MRQKAINLDKDKMKSLFPSLVAAENSARYPVRVDWFFSDGPAVEVTQNVTLSEKNWRLNSMPWVTEDVGVGDIVVCQILGDDAPAESRVPTGVALALVKPGDEGFAWLDERLPEGGFANIDDADLFDAREWSQDSAIWELIEFLTRGLTELIDDVLADADAASVPKIGLRSIDSTGSTREAVQRLALFRAAIGLGGETLVDAMLEWKCDEGQLVSYEWVSATNATAPIDFRAAVADDGDLSIEVKTTKGVHHIPFFISTAELREARAANSYELWRVSDFTFNEGELAGSVMRGDPSELVSQTLTWLETSPEGIKVPSVQMSPQSMTWTKPESATCPASRVPSETWASEIDLAAS